MKQKIGYVYLLRNLVNGKGYVGQTRARNVEARWSGHIKDAEKPRPKYPIHRAIKYYGVEKFSAEVVWKGAVELLNVKECFYVKKYNTFIDNGRGYNLTAGNGVGVTLSKSTLEKRSAASTKLWAEPNRRLRAGEVSRKRWQCSEYRLKMSTMFSRRWKDPEFKAQGSVILERRWQDPVYRAKMSASRKAMWNRPGFREAWIAKRKKQ